MSEFQLYPQEQRWWSFNDYREVLRVTRALKPGRVLEFGPGSSTLALLEGGADHVTCLEDNPDWARTYYQRLSLRFPDRVTIVPYVHAERLRIPQTDGERFDLALIDGPRSTPLRAASIRYALARCQYVLVCLEEWKCAPTLRTVVLEEAGADREVTIRVTGPLSGAFALVYPPHAVREDWCTCRGEHTCEGHRA